MLGTPALPFWGRVTVIESPLDEEETPSGLVVPRSAFASEASDGAVARRGLVQSVEADVFPEGTPARTCAEKLTPGTLVYFRDPTPIGAGLLVVDLSDILAYEP